MLARNDVMCCFHPSHKLQSTYFPNQRLVLRVNSSRPAAVFPCSTWFKCRFRSDYCLLHINHSQSFRSASQSGYSTMRSIDTQLICQLWLIATVLANMQEVAGLSHGLVRDYSERPNIFTSKSENDVCDDESMLALGPMLRVVRSLKQKVPVAPQNDDETRPKTKNTTKTLKFRIVLLS